MQAQQARQQAAQEAEIALNEALIEERDLGIRDIVRQVCCMCVCMSGWVHCTHIMHTSTQRMLMHSWVVSCLHASGRDVRLVCVCARFQIGEVNEMFQDLAVLINDQGEQVR
jgi:hypothetical protein